MPLLRRAWTILVRYPKILLATLGVFVAIFASVFVGGLVAGFVSPPVGIAVGGILVIWLGVQTQAAVFGYASMAVRSEALGPYWQTGTRLWLPTALYFLTVGIVGGVLVLIFGFPLISAVWQNGTGANPLSAAAIGDLAGSLLLLVLVLLAIVPLVVSFQAALYMSETKRIGPALQAMLRICFREKRYFYWFGVAVAMGVLNTLVTRVFGLFSGVPVLGFVLQNAAAIAVTSYASVYIFSAWSPVPPLDGGPDSDVLEHFGGD